MKKLTPRDYKLLMAWVVWGTVLCYMINTRNWNVVALFLVSFVLYHMFVVRKP